MVYSPLFMFFYATDGLIVFESKVKQMTCQIVHTFSELTV